MITKWLFWTGIALILASAVSYALSKWGLQLGKLPFDFRWHFGKQQGVSVFFPLGTSILLSILVSLILYLVSRFSK